MEETEEGKRRECTKDAWKRQKEAYRHIIVTEILIIHTLACNYTSWRNSYPPNALALCKKK